MRFSFSRPWRQRLAVVLLLAAFAPWTGAEGAAPESPRRRKKTAPAEEKEDEAKPEETPAAAKRKSDARKKADNAEPTPTPTPAPSPTPPAERSGAGPAATSSVPGEEIKGLDQQPEPVRRLLGAALALTQQNLTYTYGSSDPSAGGMDCSGTIYYLLKSNGFPDVPRQANEQYVWVRKSGRFQAVLSRRADSFELDDLRPGDLLFWTGTYKVDRDPPVTHTMIYLGRRKTDNKPLMVGASDGRPYDGQRRNGVSVFDFKLPAARSGDTADTNTAAAPDRAPNFAGYGPIPGMERREKEREQPTPAEAKKEAEPTPAGEPSKGKGRKRRAW